MVICHKLILMFSTESRSRNWVSWIYIYHGKCWLWHQLVFLGNLDCLNLWKLFRLFKIFCSRQRKWFWSMPFFVIAVCWVILLWNSMKPVARILQSAELATLAFSLATFQISNPPRPLGQKKQEIFGHWLWVSENENIHVIHY